MPKGADTYRRRLREAVRALWQRVNDYDQFVEGMIFVVRRGLGRAFDDGAKEVGIVPADFSPEERLARENAIVTENNFIDRLANAIIDLRKETPEDVRPKLPPPSLMNRVDLWVQRYRDVQNRAKAMAGEDQKLKFVNDPSKENCRSCLKLNNKVKRASYWKRVDVRPQHSTKLLCMISAGGPSVCGCEFVVTDEALSRGPLPRLP